MSHLLILDFDGTITDAEEEGKPFREGYLEDVATLSGLSLEETLKLAVQFEEEIAQSPNNHGWLFGGQIVAPASVDPYLRIMPVARMVFDHCGVFPSDEDRNRLLDGILYKYNYQKTRIAFRPHARDVLTSLEGTATYVVTNSHTEPVQNKIQQLGQGALDWLVERVHGRAKKYVVDPNFADVPQSLSLPGLERPVLLRRAQYAQILNQLREEASVPWDKVIVVGDIFELDLALPLSLGAQVGLTVNDFTPPYEIDYLAEHPRARLLYDIREIPTWLKEAEAEANT